MLELVNDTRLDLAASAARFGLGVFETIRLERGHPRWLEFHLERLREGCAALGMESPPPVDDVRHFVLRDTGAFGLDRGVLRLVAVDRRLIAWAEPFPPALPPALRLGLSRALVRNSSHPLIRFKTLSYAENRLLAREAAARGLDEVVAANESGNLTDTARFTLVAALGGKLWTPPLAAGPLPGIGRRVLLQGGLAAERSLAWEDLRQAEALGLVNALRGLIPVSEAEGIGPFDPRHPALDAARAHLAPR